MKRNGEIDCLRFVFSVLILLLHFGGTLHFPAAPYGSIGVEFFFIVTGYFMARHAKALCGTRDGQAVSIGDETWRYIFRKISSFYRYYVAAILLEIVLVYVIGGKGISAIMENGLKSIPTLTITFLGLNGSNDIGFYAGSTWYLSAMAIAIFILYPILLKNYDAAVKLFFPAAAMAIIGAIYGIYGTLNVWNKWTGLITVGVPRAIGEIALGCCACPLAEGLGKWFDGLPQERKGRCRTGLSLVKYASYAVIIGYALNRIPRVRTDAGFALHAMCFCFIGVVICLSGASWSVPDCAVTRTLGRLSLTIFIFHGVIRQALKQYGIDSVAFPAQFWAGVVFAIAACILLMALTDLAAGRLKRLRAR